MPNEPQPQSHSWLSGRVSKVVVRSQVQIFFWTSLKFATDVATAFPVISPPSSIMKGLLCSD